MEYVEWFFKIAVAGLALWAVRGYITERTKKRKAGDQVLSQDEITKQIKAFMPDCKVNQEACRKQVTKDIEIQGSLIVKTVGTEIAVVQNDLEHGRRQFEDHTKEIRLQRDQMSEMTGAFNALTGEIRRMNGSKVGG